MDIYYLGHSSFKLVGKDVTIVTDPYSSQMVGLKFPSIGADIVTISHDHEDHNQHQQLEQIGKLVSGPGEYEIKKVSIFGLPSYHDDKKGEERGKNTIYVIEMEDLRIVHLGDLGHKLSESDIEAMGEVDILMIPVGGKYTIDYKVAAEIARTIEPKIILPMHYKLSGMNEEHFGELDDAEQFVAEMGLRKENMKKLTVKQSSLNPEEQIIVLLEQK